MTTTTTTTTTTNNTDNEREVWWRRCIERRTADVLGRWVAKRWAEGKPFGDVLDAPNNQTFDEFVGEVMEAAEEIQSRWHWRCSLSYALPFAVEAVFLGKGINEALADMHETITREYKEEGDE